MGDEWRFPPEGPEIVVELPRGTFVKRRSDGAVDFISPLPCPYNYGSVPDVMADDGDALDAVVLGARLPRGTRLRVPVQAVMGFIDGGVRDDKLVCSRAPLSRAERRGLELFFHTYAIFKRALARLRGAGGPTRCEGWRT